MHAYAPSFFSDRHHTPWGAAINFDGIDSTTVRQFFIHNALYWLEEYHLDGLRLDAVHAICDDSEPDILEELAQTVARGLDSERHVHLVLENDHNAAHYFKRGSKGQSSAYAAQWNDDIHHALHVLATGDAGGYYEDYAERPAVHLARCLTEGFAYQGEPSKHRNGAARGESTQDVPLTAFVSFLQNHDQVGNRARGERITELASEQTVRAVTAVMLLAPSPPLLFMGQEWAASQPFLFFCDFEAELAKAVTEGRRREFARFPEFSDPAARERIPDPNDIATYRATILDWSQCDESDHAAWLAFHRELLQLRQSEIVPRLGGMEPGNTRLRWLGERAFEIGWRLGDLSVLTLVANLSNASVAAIALPAGRRLYSLTSDVKGGNTLVPWEVAWFLTGPH